MFVYVPLICLFPFAEQYLYSIFLSPYFSFLNICTIFVLPCVEIRVEGMPDVVGRNFTLDGTSQLQPYAS